MMSCLTWASRFGWNAPHLTDGRAEPYQLQRRAAFHPAVDFNDVGNSFFNVLVRCDECQAVVCTSSLPGFITQPNSAAVHRPVLQRQMSMASCLANATAIFFFKD